MMGDNGFIRLDQISESKLNELPGLYAFYYKPRLAQYDLYLHDDEEGKFSLTRHIQEKYLDTISIKKHYSRIRLDYGRKLDGNLVESGKRIEDKDFKNQVTDSSFRVSEILSDKCVRASFSKIEDEVFFKFSSPVYIGVANNIRNRLTHHKDKYFESVDLLQRDGQLGTEEFGARAAMMAEPEELFVTVFYLDSEEFNLSRSSAYKLSIVFEWIMQQRCKPILGER